MTPLQEFISLLVDDRGPIKGVDLAVEVATHQHGVNPQQITEALDDLIRRGEIVEVEYVLERMNYRCKTMYFPRGTEVRLKHPEDAGAQNG